MAEVKIQKIWGPTKPYQADSEVEETTGETSEKDLNKVQVNSKAQVKNADKLVNENFRSERKTLVTQTKGHREKTREERKKIRNASQRKKYRERKRYQLKNLQRENELLRAVLEERNKVVCDRRCCYTVNRITKIYRSMSSKFTNLVCACKSNN